MRVVVVVVGLFLTLIAPVLQVSPVWADSTQQTVTDLINNVRQQNGESPLTVSPELTSSAQSYAQLMASEDFVSHVGLDGSTFDGRDEAAGYRQWTILEENLAGGQPDASQAVAAWLASPTHRKNILAPQVRETGVGFAYKAGSTYKYYWVEEFGARPAAPPPVAATTWTSPNGLTVSGAWLEFVRGHGDLDNFGLPESNVITDPVTGQTVQYFQRAILEWHPENASSSQIEPRLLGDQLFPTSDPPVAQSNAPAGPSEYFPVSTDHPTGLGHFVADNTASGEAIYFKDYFDGHGGVAAFGYPKEEPKLRNGRWTQRFQAAVFEYHPEYDQDGVVAGTAVPLRTYRVQLALLTDLYKQVHP